VKVANRPRLIRCKSLWV